MGTFIQGLASEATTTLTDNSRAFGESVAVIGDINGDGFVDFAIATRETYLGSYDYYAGTGGYAYGGVYVVFGDGGRLDERVDLSDLGPDEGFAIAALGTDFNTLGVFVSAAGDFNGDGFADLLITDSGVRRGYVEYEDYYGDPFVVERDLASSFVVFGSDQAFPEILDLNALDGSDGFEIAGRDDDYNVFGLTIDGGGDFNGDGIDDLLIVDKNAGAYGEVYVLFGDDDGAFAADFELTELDGINGVRIVGDADFFVSDAVSFAGDVDGDGIDDIILGDPDANYDEYYGDTAGAAVILFGSDQGFGATLSTSTGLGITGSEANARLGSTVAGIGDVNGDGIDDFLIAAENGGPLAESGYFSYGRAGAVYVVFGSETGFDGPIDVGALDGTNGFEINGDIAFRHVGAIAAGIGDLNGDGIDDFAVSAENPAGYYGQDNPVYILFGGAEFGASIDLNDLARDQGIELISGRIHDIDGLGDIDGDGVDDVLISSHENGYYGDIAPIILYGSTAFGGENDAPTAVDDVLSLFGPTTVSLTANNGAGPDFDPDLDELTVTAINGTPVAFGDLIEFPSGLIVVFLGGDQVRIAAPRILVGEAVADSFTYTISDGEAEATATVNVDLKLTARPIIDDGVRGVAIDANGSREVEIIGDVNGDGVADFMLSDPFVSYYDDYGGNSSRNFGESFVVFGSTDGFPPSISVDDLDGTDGFTISGADNYDYFGYSFGAAGDFNGDGFADFLVAEASDYDDGVVTQRVFLVFGSGEGFAPEIASSDIDGTNGIVLIGRDVNSAYDELHVASAGDVNGDGFDDILLASENALGTVEYTYYDYYGGTYTRTETREVGKAFVIFGSESPVQTLGLAQGDGQPAAAFDFTSLDGANGFVMAGADTYDYVGRNVAGIGDINGDGFDDFAVSSQRVADFDEYVYGSTTSRQIHVVFGNGEGFSAEVDLAALDGTNGFSIAGSNGDFRIGEQFAGIGDFNGDGIDDFLFSAPNSGYYDYYTDPPGGSVFVLFGVDASEGSFAARLTTDQIDGTNGFRISAADEFAELGVALSAAGDVNGDGFADILVQGDGSGGGQTYLVYGAATGFGAELNLGDLDGSNGLVIGPPPSNYGDGDVAGGADLTGDGVPDAIILRDYGDEVHLVTGGQFSSAQPFIGAGYYRFDEDAISVYDGGFLIISDFAGPLDASTKRVDVGGYAGAGRITITGGEDPVQITVEDPDAFYTSSVIGVGVGRGAEGSLTIENGARLTSVNTAVYDPYEFGAQRLYGGYYNVNIGVNGGEGVVVVDGEGSFLGAYGGAPRITVGRGRSYYYYGDDTQGSGQLTVSNGGAVGSLQFVIGRQYGQGAVTVTGEGSTLTSSSSYGQLSSYYGQDNSGQAGSIRLGREGGEGRLFIEDGGLATVFNQDGLTDNPFISLGETEEAYGLVRIDGEGSELRLEQIGAFGDDDASGAFIGIGRQGQGRVEVQNGGVLNVLGDGATLDLGNNFLGGTPTDEENALVVSGGGVVNVNTYLGRYGGIRVARDAGTNGTVIVDGEGSEINVTTDAEGTEGTEAAFFQVGRGGDGRLEVTNGGRVNIDGGNERFPTFMVGVDDGSTGYALIDGAGSAVVIEGANTEELASDGFLSVGRNSGARGEVVISNGGLLDNAGVTAASEIAGNAGTEGSVTVTGAGSRFLAGTRLSVGADFDNDAQTAIFDVGGAGSLSILDGGRVEAGYAAIGDNGVIAISGGVLAADVVSAGVFEVGGERAAGEAQVIGDFTQLQGEIRFEFLGFGPGAADLLTIDGAAEIAAEAIVLDASGLGALATGESFTFLTATGALTFDETAIDLSAIEAEIGADFAIDRFFADGLDQLALRVVDAPANSVGVQGFDQALAEGDPGDDTVFVYTVRRASDLSGSLTLEWAVTGTGESPATGDDFEGGVLPSGEIVFAAGEAEAVVEIRVAEDLTGESDNSFDFTISNPQSGGATFEVFNATASGVILNDDAPDVIGFFSGRPELFFDAEEGDLGQDRSVVFTLFRTGVLADAVEVSYEIQATGFGIRSAEAEDFEGPLSGSVTFAAGQEFAEISVAIAEDGVIEGAEDFTITLTGASLSPTAVELVNTRAFGRIVNDDGIYPASYVGEGDFTIETAENSYGPSGPDYGDREIRVGYRSYSSNILYYNGTYYAYSGGGDGYLTISGDANPIQYTLRYITVGAETDYYSGAPVVGELSVIGGSNPVAIVVTDVDDNDEFSSIRVGVDGGDGRMTISGGATVVANVDADASDANRYGYYAINIGRRGGTGEVVVTGEGSFLGSYGFAPRITVGRGVVSDGYALYDATGVLEVSNGAGVGGQSFNVGRDNGDGTLRVSGEGSFVNINESYGTFGTYNGQDNSGYSGGIHLGRGLNGDGRAYVTDGAAVTINNIDGLTDNPFAIAGRDGGYGLIEVDGAGSSLTVSQIGDAGDDAEDGAFLGFGRSGVGVGRVSNGGALNVLGDDATLSLAFSSTDVTGVGEESRLEISSSGVVAVDSGDGAFGVVVIANARGGAATVTVDGAGSELIARSDSGDPDAYGATVIVGDDGDGRIEVTNGGAVTIDGGGDLFPALIVGDGSTAGLGGSGHLLVSGAGSTVSVTGTNTEYYSGGGFISVGRNAGATGELVIEDGGVVANLAAVSAMEIGGRAGSEGKVTVTGAGSRLDAGGTLAISSAGPDNAYALDDGGAGELNILSGGLVTAGRTLHGAQGVLNIDGGELRSDLTSVGVFNVGGDQNIGDALIGGGFTQTGGTLAFEFLGFGAGEGDALAVTGDAEIDAASVMLDLSAVGALSDGDRFTFLSVDGDLTLDTGAIDLSAINDGVGAEVSILRETVDDGAGGTREIVSLVVAEAPPISIAFAGLDQALAEGDPGDDTVFTFTIERAGSLDDTVTVDFAVAGAGAAAADAADFEGDAFPTGQATFLPGASSATIEIRIAEDVVVEADEAFTVTLSNAQSDGPLDVVITDSEIGGVIANDDEAGVISIQSFAEATEGDTGDANTVDFVVTRTGNLIGDVTIDFTVAADGTASAADLAGGAPQTGQVMILDGQSQATISVAIAGDELVEADETFSVTLTGFDGDPLAHALGDATGVGRINNDDVPTVVSIQSFARAAEGDPGDQNAVAFTVTRSGEATGDLVVNYVVQANGTASANDLAEGAPQIRQVTIADGEAQATIFVGIAGDNVIEGAERFSVTLTGFDGAPASTVLGEQTAIGQIDNDDGATPVIFVGREADIFGDPHLVTLDGLGYDFQAVGEFTLVEAVSGAALDVQVRTAPVPGSDLVSVIAAMATDMGGGVSLMIDAFGDPALLVDGVATDVPASGAEPVSVGDGQVFFDGEGYTIVFASGEALVVKVMDGSLNVCVFLDPERDNASVRGLLGNSNGDFGDDFALRNGEPIPEDKIVVDSETGVPTLDFDYLYGAYADSWRIDDAGSLFFYSGAAGDAGTADHTDTSFPAGALSIDLIPAELLAEATALVDGLGITDPILREAAILDYALTGDENFVAGAAGVAADPEAETAPADAPTLPDTVGVIAAKPRIVEGDVGQTDVVFTFYRIGEAEDALTVDYAVGGDVDADDFAPGAALTGQIAFGAGQSTATLTLTVVADLAVETAERIVVSLSAPEGVLVGASQAVTTIGNDDAAPVAFDDADDAALETTEDQSLAIAAAALIANDLDSDGDDLVIASVSGTSAKGAAVSLGDGVVTYDPSGLFEALGDGETDTDTFTYVVSDGNGGEATATVTVTITGVNDAPVAVALTRSGPEDGQITGSLSATDVEGDDLTFSLAAGGAPANGTVTISTGGAFTFTPNANFNGPDSFVFQVADEDGLTSTATVALNVTAVNDPPVAQARSFQVGEDATLSGSLLTGQTDLDGDALTIVAVNGGAIGSRTLAGGELLTVNADGTFTFNPNNVHDFRDEGDNGTATFTFTLSDGLATSTATATITILGEDDPIATQGPDDISGTTIGDRISGLGGDDTMRGGVGNDTLSGDAGADQIFGDAGLDRLLGGAGNDRLIGGAGDDRLIGGGENDTLIGGAGNDNLNGGAGKDKLTGGGGKDKLKGGGGNDVLDGGGANDNLAGGGGNDRLIGKGGKDVLNGGGGKDVLIAGSGNDKLIGGGANDDLDGGGGKDTLAGGKGNDKLKGGGGADVFVFGPKDGNDFIRDFKDGQDKIEINGAANFTALTITERGGDAVVSFRNTTIRLDKVDADDLDAGDFIF